MKLRTRIRFQRPHAFFGRLKLGHRGVADNEPSCQDPDSVKPRPALVSSSGQRKEVTLNGTQQGD